MRGQPSQGVNVQSERLLGRRGSVCGRLTRVKDRRAYARAGHPEPVLIHADGSPAALASPGCLLGVFAEADYRSTTVPLSPGDRLVLYTDGVEDALSGGGDKEQFKRLIASIGGEELDEMLLQLAAWIDERGAKGRPEDDVTIVAMDVAE